MSENRTRTKKREETTCKKLKEHFYRITNTSTAHGIPFIFQKERSLPSRLFWTVCLIVSTGACAFLVLKAINSYLEYDAYDKMRVVYESQIEFPTVSICNINQFATNDSSLYIQKIRENNYVTDFVGSTSFGQYSSQLSRAVANYVNVRFLGILNSASTNETTRKSFGATKNQTILSCSYQLTECTEANFTWFYDSHYGNCYKFNAGHNTITYSKPGREDSLLLLLYVGIDDTLNSVATSLGAHVFIHNSSNILNFNEGINVAAGTDTNVILAKTVQTYLPYPYNDCREDLNTIGSYDSILVKEILLSNHSYRQRDCRLLCFQLELIQTCKCYDISFLQLFNAPPCTSSVQLGCVIGTYARYYEIISNGRCSNLW